MGPRGSLSCRLLRRLFLVCRFADFFLFIIGLLPPSSFTLVQVLGALIFVLCLPSLIVRRPGLAISTRRGLEEPNIGSNQHLVIFIGLFLCFATLLENAL